MTMTDDQQTERSGKNGHEPPDGIRPPMIDREDVDAAIGEGGTARERFERLVGRMVKTRETHIAK